MTVSQKDLLIVRWTLDDLPAVLLELGVERPFLVASPRWSLDVPSVGRWSVVPSPQIDVPADADSLLASALARIDPGLLTRIGPLTSRRG